MSVSRNRRTVISQDIEEDPGEQDFAEQDQQQARKTQKATCYSPYYRFGSLFSSHLTLWLSILTEGL